MRHTVGPGELLQKLFCHDPYRFARAADRCESIVNRFESYSDERRADLFFSYGAPEREANSLYHIQFEIVLRRSPDLAVFVWSDERSRHAMAMRCELEDDRFVVRDVVCCDLVYGSQMRGLIVVACSDTPFALRTVADISALVAVKEQWLRDAYNAGTPKELTPLH